MTKTQEGMLSEFQYFDPSTIQLMNQEDRTQVVHPLAQPVHGSPIEFHYTGVPDYYVDLNNSKLEVKVKATKVANAVKRPAGDGDEDYHDKAGIVNNFMHSLFKNVEVKICGQHVGEVGTGLYAHRAYLETLLSETKEVLDIRGRTQGWERDTTGYVGSAAAANTGGVARRRWINGSRTFTMIGRLHNDIWLQGKPIPSNCDIDVKLYPQAAEFLSFGEAGNQNAQPVNEFRIVSTRMILKLRKMSPAAIMAHEKTATKHNYRIPHTKVEMKRHVIPQGTTSIVLQNLLHGVLPKRLFLGLVANAAASGTATTNPFNFQNFGVSQAQLVVNHEPIPAEPIRLDFANDDYEFGYMSLLEALEQDIGERCVPIKPEDWKDGYTIYGFKLAPGPAGTTAVKVDGQVNLALTFAQATGANIDVILMTESDAILEITAGIRRAFVA